MSNAERIQQLTLALEIVEGRLLTIEAQRLSSVASNIDVLTIVKAALHPKYACKGCAKAFLDERGAWEHEQDTRLVRKPVHAIFLVKTGRLICTECGFPTGHDRRCSKHDEGVRQMDAQQADDQVIALIPDLSIIPDDALCQEASPMSHSFYIPCLRPAVAIIDNGDSRPYYMCERCAVHNVRNRRAKLVLAADRAPDFVKELRK